MGFSIQERRRTGRKKRFGGDLWALSEHLWAVLLCIPTEQLNPVPVPFPPLVWCRDVHKNLPQIPPSAAETRALRRKGVSWVVTQAQRGLGAAGFHPGSHAALEGGWVKLSPPIAAEEILALRGVRAFGARDQPGLHFETTTKHAEHSPASQAASRSAAGTDTYPAHRPHNPFQKKTKWDWRGAFPCRDVSAGGDQGSTVLEEAPAQGGEPVAQPPRPRRAALRDREVHSRVARLRVKLRQRN